MPTVLEIIQSTTGYFEKHGVESARLNAEHLTAYALGIKKRLNLYLEFDRLLGENDLAPLRTLIRERAQGKPLQHLLGTVEFLGREFLSDSRALIPRPETEQLVELVLKSGNLNSKSTVLDVGTGSGIIAITLALEIPEANIFAIDQSLEALALARENAAKWNVAVNFIHGNLLPDSPVQFDFIIANLPYIPAAEIPTLSREVQYDPISALDGGSDGLDLIRKLIELSISRLSPGGQIFLEIGYDQAAPIRELLVKFGYHNVSIYPDYSKIERFIRAEIS